MGNGHERAWQTWRSNFRRVSARFVTKFCRKITDETVVHLIQSVQYIVLLGCHMVDSCSNIQTGEQFGRLLRHNFNRHFSTNRAPLGLHFHASWLKSKKEFKDELIKFIEEMLKRNDVYFVNMLQVSLNPFIPVGWVNKNTCIIIYYNK